MRRVQATKGPHAASYTVLGTFAQVALLGCTPTDRTSAADGVGDSRTTITSPPPTDSGAEPPAQAAAPLKVVELAASGNNVYARMSDGTIRGWGANDTGQLTLAEPIESATPVEINGVRGAIDLDAGSLLHGYACALTNEGELVCWGSRSAVADGKFAERYPPTSRGTFPGATALALGGHHGCLILADQTVKCWGDGKSGKLGDGTSTEASAFVSVMGLTGARQLALGPGYSCALHGEGLVSCWGSNKSKQVQPAVDDGLDVSTPSQVSLPAPAVQVTTRADGPCALLEDRSLACWGGSYLPAGLVVEPPRDITALWRGRSRHDCVLLNGGVVECRGHADHGALGTGVREYLIRAEFSTVSGLPPVEQVVVGDEFTCALIEDGRVMCWGGNGHGVLGDGTQVDRLHPVEVTGLLAPTLAPPSTGWDRAARDGPALTYEGLPAACGQPTTLAISTSDSSKTELPIVFAVARVREDRKQIDIELRDHPAEPWESCTTSQPNGEHLCVQLTLKVRDEYDKKDPVTGEVEHFEFDRKVETGTYHPPLAWITSNKRTRRMGNTTVLGSRLVVGINPTSVHRVGESDTIEITHIGDDWVCGVFDLESSRTGALRGRFAAPVR